LSAVAALCGLKIPSDNVFARAYASELDTELSFDGTSYFAVLA